MRAPELTESDIRQAWKDANVAPLWENTLAHGGGKYVDRAHHWPWRTMSRLVAQALELTGMDVVERRVLSLINPEPRWRELNGSSTNITGHLQILAPRELARPHRHSMNALRFVIEGSGATTIVDGKACRMEQGDLVLTPGWTWHEHVHNGDAPIVWLDVLDAQLHRFLGTDAFEPGPVHDLPLLAPDIAFASANLVPEAAPNRGYSPVFRYPWAAAAAAVEVAPRGADGARRVRYTNPLDGGAVLALIDCAVIQLDPGTTTLPFRTSAQAICTVVEGSGSTAAGDDEIAWEAKDVFTLPRDQWIVHRAGDTPARIFVASDREVLRRLGLLKEEIGT